ncbi:MULTISPECIES: cytochrome P450 [unclassified Lysobacter]|uniref:cytochrome P450 n=1 Tax=unclassified Lysobacter TaxID=2635362 RepID=UPI001BE519CA|nr:MULTISPECIES: cytochrome P450 [unclassified Lysobacter]MBT2750049.1 cytochrome P450 [Lysobacter sp. ISL-50]MBT2775379.1 cytochrome P450 [Lysobacter sp. ISL-54]MBT2783502.1 cytochrome P450 [Lysobacter sp. ISL-52]
MERADPGVNIKGSVGESGIDAASGKRRLGAIERRRGIAEDIAGEVGRLTRAKEVALRPDTLLSDVGIDSLGGMELLGYIERKFGVAIPISTLLGSTSFDELVTKIEQFQGSAGAVDGEIHSTELLRPRTWDRKARATLLRDWRIAAPLFLIPGLNGTTYYLSSLCKALHTNRACIAFQMPGVDGLEPPLGSIEEIARRHVEEMRAIQPHGPYAIAGHSFGGVVAYEMAQMLAEQGQQVAPLMLLDSPNSESEDGALQDDEVMALFEVIGVYCRFSERPLKPIRAERLSGLPVDEQLQLLWSLLASYPTAAHVIATYRKGFVAMTRYRPRPYGGPVILFRSAEGFPAEAMHPERRVRSQFDSSTLGWGGLCADLRIVETPGDHFSMVMPPHSAELGAAMQEPLNTAADMLIDFDRLRPATVVTKVGRALRVDGARVHFDPHHPDFREDPYPFLSQLREHTPIFQDALSQWWVTRHADVSAGLRNRLLSVDARAIDHVEGIGSESAKPSALSSWFRNQDASALAQLYNKFLLFIDAPRHTVLRKVFSPSFSHESIRHLAGCIDERVETLMADMRAKPRPDLMRDLALPLPVGVISLIYGVPDADSAQVTQWARDLATGLDSGMSLQAMRRAERSAEEFTRYLHGHVQRLRKSPPHTPGGARLDVNEAIAQGITPDELVAHIAMSYLAGFETTTNSIGNGTLALLRHPDQLERLRSDPALAENASEELLRYDCPVMFVMRFAVEDLEVAGQRIARGSSITFMLASANRDPAAFPDPDRLDLARPARHHVAFSNGAHYCLGAPLARLELQRVFVALSRQRFQPVPGGLAWRDAYTFRALERFPIAWCWCGSQSATWTRSSMS